MRPLAKVHFHAVQWSSSGPELLLVARPGRRRRRCGRSWKGSCATRSGRGGCGRASGCRRTRALAEQPRAVPRYGAGLLRPARRRGLPGRARRVGDPGRRSARHAQPVAPAARTARSGPRLIADFASGVPDLGLVPARRLGVGGGRGLPDRPERRVRLRRPARRPRGCATVLAGYLRRVRAAAATADRTVVCAGFPQGLTSRCARWPARGRRPGRVRGPGLRRHRDRLAADAPRSALVPVPVDEHGIDVDALAASGRRRGRRHARRTSGRPAWCSPPSGGTRWSTGPASTTAVVVEDDYDAEFRYDREPVGSLQGLAPDRVVTLGTVSKSLAPALRLGWVVCPAELAGAGRRRPSRWPTAARPGSTSSRWPPSSSPAATTGTCAGCAARTRPARGPRRRARRARARTSR